MIKLNLLSPREKEEIRWEKINRILTVNGLIIIIELVVFVVLLLLAQAYLYNKLSNLNNLIIQKQQETEVKEIKDIKDKARYFNERLDLVDKIQNEQVSWTKILEKLSLTAPNTIQITSLDIKAILLDDSKENNETKNIIGGREYRFGLIGRAKTRDDLLEFENNLRNSDYFTDLKPDQSNYLKARNADFRYEFYLTEKILEN